MRYRFFMTTQTFKSLISLNHLPRLNWDSLESELSNASDNLDYAIAYAIGLIEKGEFIERHNANCKRIDMEISVNSALLVSVDVVNVGYDCDSVTATWSCELPEYA